jgi:hypothetical protein
MQRRKFLTGMLGTAASLTLRPADAQPVSNDVFIERPVTGTPHKGKVLAAIQRILTTSQSLPRARSPS